MLFNRKILCASLIAVFSGLLAAPAWADGVFATSGAGANTNATTGMVTGVESADSTNDGAGIITAADGNGTSGNGAYMVQPLDTLRVPAGATFNNLGTNGGGSLEVNGTMEVDGVLNNTNGVMTVNVTNGGRLLFGLGSEYQGPGVLNTIDGTLVQAPADLIGLPLLWTDITGTADQGNFMIVSGSAPVTLPQKTVVGNSLGKFTIQGDLAPTKLITLNSIDAGSSPLEISNVQLISSLTFKSTTSLTLSGVLKAAASFPVVTIDGPLNLVDVNGLVIELATCPLRNADITVVTFINSPSVPADAPLVKCTDAGGIIWSASIETVAGANLGKVLAANWQRAAVPAPQNIPVNNPWFLLALGLLCALVAAKTPRFLQRKS